MLKEGFSAEEITNSFYRFGMNADWKVNDIIRARFLKAVAQCHARIAGGIGSEIQLARMLSECVQ